jgi:hypothetical protein
VEAISSIIQKEQQKLEKKAAKRLERLASGRKLSDKQFSRVYKAINKFGIRRG